MRNHCRVLSRGKSPAGEETSVEVGEAHIGSSRVPPRRAVSHTVTTALCPELVTWSPTWKEAGKGGKLDGMLGEFHRLNDNRHST